VTIVELCVEHQCGRAIQPRSRRVVYERDNAPGQIMRLLDAIPQASIDREINARTRAPCSDNAGSATALFPRTTRIKINRDLIGSLRPPLPFHPLSPPPPPLPSWSEPKSRGNGKWYSDSQFIYHRILSDDEKRKREFSKSCCKLLDTLPALN